MCLQVQIPEIRIKINCRQGIKFTMPKILQVLIIQVFFKQLPKFRACSYFVANFIVGLINSSGVDAGFYVDRLPS